MTMAKRIVSATLVFCMLICTLFTAAIPASAATYSSGTSTRTITVSTKANYWIPGSESITLSQTKGVCEKKSYNFFQVKPLPKSPMCMASGILLLKPLMVVIL